MFPVSVCTLIASHFYSLVNLFISFPIVFSRLLARRFSCRCSDTQQQLSVHSRLPKFPKLQQSPRQWRPHQMGSGYLFSGPNPGHGWLYQEAKEYNCLARSVIQTRTTTASPLPSSRVQQEQDNCSLLSQPLLQLTSTCLASFQTPPSFYASCHFSSTVLYAYSFCLISYSTAPSQHFSISFSVPQLLQLPSFPAFLSLVLFSARSFYHFYYFSLTSPANVASTFAPLSEIAITRIGHRQAVLLQFCIFVLLEVGVCCCGLNASSRGG